MTRRTALGRAAIGAAAIIGAAPAAARAAGATPLGGEDVRRLRLALSLKHLQARLYTQAGAAAGIGPAALEFARVAGAHERAHIALLRELLGPSASDPPPVDLRRAASDEAEFVTTAIRLEDLTVRALNGQAAHLAPRALEVTARIAAMDARHVAWIRGIAGITPSHRVRDEGRGAREVARALERFGLIPAGLS